MRWNGGTVTVSEIPPGALEHLCPWCPEPVDLLLCQAHVRDAPQDGDRSGNGTFGAAARVGRPGAIGKGSFHARRGLGPVMQC